MNEQISMVSREGRSSSRDEVRESVLSCDGADRSVFRLACFLACFEVEPRDVARVEQEISDLRLRFFFLRYLAPKEGSPGDRNQAELAYIRKAIRKLAEIRKTFREALTCTK